MINKFNSLAIIIVLLLSLSIKAHAQSMWGDWYVTPSIVYNDDDPDRKTDDGVNGFQIVVGRDFRDRYSVEALLGVANPDGFYSVIRNRSPYFRDDEEHLDLSANFLIHYDRDAVLDPYIMFGIGYLGIDYNFDGGEENRPTGSLGIGLNWKPWSDRFAIRSELRGRLAYEEDLNYFDYTATIGLQWTFGRPGRGPGAPSKDGLKDTDGDGVLDMWDECPDTPPGVAVTARGCEIRDMTRDGDNDRVPDYRDECPNTPIGSAVDLQGCALDSDLDGVPTERDLCPASAPGAVVDENGCADDSDADGVLDQYDRCPDSTPGQMVDIYGCEIRDVIRLPGVNFTTGSDQLMSGAEQLLRDAAATLNKFPELRIEVAGHTDNVGSSSSNLSLSGRRAETVRDQLANYGVNPARLTFRGYGDQQPIADNTTPDGRARNRRVELRILRD